MIHESRRVVRGRQGVGDDFTCPIIEISSFFLTYIKMKISELKEKLKKRGLRVTKDVKGKRVPLSRKEMLVKLGLKSKSRKKPLNREVHRVRKFIRVCKMVLMNLNNTKRPTNNTKRALPPPPRSMNTNAPRRVAPPPPPPPPPPRSVRAPPPPPAVNPREALMANLKANLKRRGLSNN